MRLTCLCPGAKPPVIIRRPGVKPKAATDLRNLLAAAPADPKPLAPIHNNTPRLIIKSVPLLPNTSTVLSADSQGADAGENRSVISAPMSDASSQGSSTGESSDSTYKPSTVITLSRDQLTEVLKSLAVKQNISMSVQSAENKCVDVATQSSPKDRIPTTASVHTPKMDQRDASVKAATPKVLQLVRTPKGTEVRKVLAAEVLDSSGRKLLLTTPHRGKLQAINNQNAIPGESLGVTGQVMTPGGNAGMKRAGDSLEDLADQPVTKQVKLESDKTQVIASVSEKVLSPVSGQEEVKQSAAGEKIEESKQDPEDGKREDGMPVTIADQSVCSPDREVKFSVPVKREPGPVSGCSTTGSASLANIAPAILPGTTTTDRLHYISPSLVRSQPATPTFQLSDTSSPVFLLPARPASLGEISSPSMGPGQPLLAPSPSVGPGQPLLAPSPVMLGGSYVTASLPQNLPLATTAMRNPPTTVNAMKFGVAGISPLTPVSDPMLTVASQRVMLNQNPRGLNFTPTPTGVRVVNSIPPSSTNMVNLMQYFGSPVTDKVMTPKLEAIPSQFLSPDRGAVLSPLPVSLGSTVPIQGGSQVYTPQPQVLRIRDRTLGSPNLTTPSPQQTVTVNGKPLATPGTFYHSTPWGIQTATQTMGKNSAFQAFKRFTINNGEGSISTVRRLELSQDQA